MATDKINQSFNSFTSDYLQAERAYIASNAATTTGETTTTAFSVKNFGTLTQGRVDLLAQELTRAMSVIPAALVRAKGQRLTPLQSFLTTRIDGRGPTALRTILSSPDVLPPTNANGPTVTLYTIQAQNAIEAARIATINSAIFTDAGTFAKHSHHGKNSHH